MGVPVYHGDFYSDDFILNPTQGYADLRALGPVTTLLSLDEIWKKFGKEPVKSA